MELFPQPPPDLKIPQPEFPNPLDIVTALANFSEGNTSEGEKSTSIKTLDTFPANYFNETLAIVINIWRIKSRITDGLSKKPKEELTKEDVKKIARYLESIHDSLTQLGIEIIDRSGETFDYGLPEKVVTAKPQEGISKELVIETLRPTIKWGNQLYPGEVEIATPITKSDKGEES